MMFHGRFAKGARGRKPRIPGEMNKTEAAYGDVLKAQLIAGEIEDYKFESIKFRLADRTWYTPDFMVQAIGGQQEIHEVKAMTSKGKVLIEDDANVKLKVVAEQYSQYVFKVCAMRPKKLGGGFDVREL
jgi:hypothetical protein